MFKKFKRYKTKVSLFKINIKNKKIQKKNNIVINVRCKKYEYNIALLENKRNGME